ncbi:MAG TPA: hypothetical protein VI111_10405 [Thermoleophilaceae bacterium]
MAQATLHIHEAVRILELTDPPFDVRAIEKTRRRLAKQWHPDHASPDQRAVHERHMIDINRSADLLIASAEDVGGELTLTHIRMSEQAQRERQREAAERAEAAEWAAAAASGRRGPRRASAPSKSVVHSYARSRTHPEWGVGTIASLFATGEGDEMRRWATVDFDGKDTRTLRYENLEFVVFGVADPGHERAARFMVAAAKATAAGDHELAVRRLIYARNATPDAPAVLRPLAAAQREARDFKAAARTARHWARVEPENPEPQLVLAAVYVAMGARDLAIEATAEAERRTNGKPHGPKRVDAGSGRTRRKHERRRSASNS